MQSLAARCHQELYPQGTTILVRGKSKVDALCLIIKGRIKVFFTDEESQESLIDYRGAGMSIGALDILRDSLSNFDVVIVEDAPCLMMSRENFLKLIADDPRFRQRYLKLISESYVGKALAELQRLSPQKAPCICSAPRWGTCPAGGR
ncbi:hypothetical protein DFAR_3000012 [Desulfarculales bacterium]